MNKPLKTVSLDTLIDKHIGTPGTPRRDAFENELKIELLGYAIKQARQERNLTQNNLENWLVYKKLKFLNWKIVLQMLDLK